MALSRLQHAVAAGGGKSPGRLLERALADKLHDLLEVQIVEQPVAAEQHRVARSQAQRATDLDRI